MSSSAGVVGVDDQVDALAEHVQLGVGDERGHLDELVLAEVEPGHLAVDPDQKIRHALSLRAVPTRVSQRL